MREKLAAAACLAALMLTSCGTDVEESSDASFKAPETTAAEDTTEVSESLDEQAETAETSEETTVISETSTENDTETTSAITSEPDGMVSAGGRMDMYPAMYQNEIQKVWDELYANEEMVSVDYAYRDLDADGIPELMLKHGTCEADYMITFYTVNENNILEVIGETGGGHSVFAYDENSGDLVISRGHMGYGELQWFVIKDGKVTASKSESYELAQTENYEDIEKQKGVVRIDTSGAYCSGDNIKSYVCYSNGKYESKDGLDFTMLGV